MKKIKRKIISLFLMFILVMLTMIKPADAEERFSTAEETVSDFIVGWNLGNTLDCTGDWINQYTEGKPGDFEKAWGNPITTKAMIKSIKDAGFNSVRIPVTYEGHFDKGANIDKEWLDRVEEVVNYVKDEGMYCIINLHHDTGTSGWLKASSVSSDQSSITFQMLWKQIAVRFSDYDDKLLFEGFNEIIDDDNNWGSTSDINYKVVNDLYQIFVDVVRSTGGNNKYRNLIVNSYASNSGDANLKKIKLPHDTVENHLIVEVHNYDPQSFTSTSATWTTMTDQWGSDSDKEKLDKTFNNLKKFSDNNGVPVIIGEFGCEDKNNDSERGEYVDYFVRSAAKLGIKCFWWDDGGGFKLLDRTSVNLIHPEVVKAMTSAAYENKTTLVKEEQSIYGVSSSYNKTYGDSSFTLSAKSTGDGKIAYSSSDTGIIGVDSNTGKVTIKGAGKAIITVTAAATVHYDQSIKSINILINKKSQVIQGVSSNYIKSKSISSFNLNAITSGEGKITYLSSNESIVKINASTGKVTIKGLGTAKITITAAETKNYKKASKTVSVKIVP